MRGVIGIHSLPSHFLFHMPFDKAEWEADADMWRIEPRDVRTGKKHFSYATAPRVCNTRRAVEFRLPDLQGIETSEGEVFHLVRWRHDADLWGKLVGMLGNGCSL